MRDLRQRRGSGERSQEGEEKRNNGSENTNFKLAIPRGSSLSRQVISSASSSQCKAPKRARGGEGELLASLPKWLGVAIAGATVALRPVKKLGLLTADGLAI